MNNYNKILVTHFDSIRSRFNAISVSGKKAPLQLILKDIQTSTSKKSKEALLREIWPFREEIKELSLPLYETICKFKEKDQENVAHNV